MDRFEELAERLLEGPFARLPRNRLHPIEIAKWLRRAMEDGQIIGVGGQVVAPNRYRVFLHPADYRALQSFQATLEIDLGTYLMEVIAKSGATTIGRPLVQLMPSHKVAPKRVQVLTSLLDEGQTKPKKHSTRPMPNLGQTATSRPYAFLFYGQRPIPLNKPLLAIGRSRDNDIVLEDRRISRHHVQLQWRRGRFTLYDLGSRGGTTVNGRPVGECVLSEGDVISLGGVRLVLSYRGRRK
jgi:hypothetical protein